MTPKPQSVVERNVRSVFIYAWVAGWFAQRDAQWERTKIRPNVVPEALAQEAWARFNALAKEIEK
jgi:hypothetical protein